MKPHLEEDPARAKNSRDESFLKRFNRRKSEAREAVKSDLQSQQQVEDAAVEEEIVLTDEDMPPLESLTPESDYSLFMSSGVSDLLRKQALRKLFHSEEFNFISELDEYAEDFTTFAALGDIVTSDMKHQFKMEAKRRLEAALEADASSDEIKDEQSALSDVEVAEVPNDAMEMEMDDVDVESEL